MFVRSKVAKGTRYYAVVESYRDDGRVRHRPVVALGRCPTVRQAIDATRRAVLQLEETRRLMLGLNPGGGPPRPRRSRVLTRVERQLGRHRERLECLLQVEREMGRAANVQAE
jgi:hypothetical protein